MPHGQARAAAEELAAELAALPQQCMRPTGSSALDQWGLSDAGGASTSNSPARLAGAAEAVAGAARFAAAPAATAHRLKFDELLAPDELFDGVRAHVGAVALPYVGRRFEPAAFR